MPDIDSVAGARAERWRDWLNDEQGLDFVHLRPPLLDDPTCVPRGYWIAIYGNKRAIREAAEAVLEGIPTGERRPAHAVVYQGDEIVWNPWGVEVDADELGDLLVGLALVPLELQSNDSGGGLLIAGDVS